MRMRAVQVEALSGEVLPIEVRVLPADLERLDRVLADEALLAPVARRWQTASPAAVGRDRATVPIVVYVRLMVVKQRARVGVRDARA